MRTAAVLLPLSLAAATIVSCARRDSDRDHEFAQCVDIYRTTYVAGQVSDCLTQRYGWSVEDARKAERERLGAHPDSGSRADSGRLGDSTR
jgi:hypothetical protein